MKGKFVMFALPKNTYIPNPKTDETTKQVVCAAGDELSRKGDAFYCNGRFIGMGKHYSLKGIPVKLFEFQGTIPEGQLFVMGDNRDSYDSRYFGFISLSDVKGVVYPLL